MAATDKVEIHASARVVGDIVAPRVVIEDGAKFKGHIEMPAAGTPVPMHRRKDREKDR